MATTRATSIGLFQNPKTPQSNKSNKCTTPGSNSIFNTKENAPSPRRSKFFDTIKLLTVRGKQRVQTETPSPKPLGRRKSAWDLFARKTRKDASSADQAISMEVKRARSVSPSKETQAQKDNHDVPSQRPRRRKSLGDIFGTITNKVTSKYNTVSQHHVPAQTPKSPPNVHGVDVDPATVSTTPVAQKFTPTLSLHLPGANFSEMDPYTVMEEMLDHFKASQNAELLNARDSPQISPSSSAWSASDTATLLEANSMTKEMKGERNEVRVDTPDEYLQDLIEAHCSSSDDLPPYEVATISSSSTKYQLSTALGALYKDCSQSSDSTKATESTSAMLIDPSMLEYESSSRRDCRPIIEIREVESTSETETDASPFCGVRAGGDEYSTARFSKALSIDNKKYTENIRLTLARMTKNYHSRSSGSDETSFERNEGKVWEAIVIGDKVLNYGPSHGKPTTIPSPKDQSKNERLVENFLEDSVGLRTLPESTATPVTPIKPSPGYGTVLGRMDSKRLTQGHPSVRKSPNLSRYKVKFVKSSSKLRPQVQPTKAAETDNRVFPCAYYVEPPTTSMLTEQRESFTFRSDAIARLRAWYRSGQIARFYAYDAENRSFKTYPSGRDLLSIQGTGNVNLTFYWLPTAEDGKITTTEGSSVPAWWEAANCVDSDNVRESDMQGYATVKGKEKESWYTEEDEHHNFNHTSEMNRALCAAWQDYEDSLQKQEENLLKPSSAAVAETKCLPECARIASYDMETYFLAREPFIVNTPGSSLVNEATSLNNKDVSVFEELLPAECEVNSDFARSFLGSQFSESRTATPVVDNFKLYRELMESEDSKELLLATLTSAPRVTKTIFDLAKEYVERHPHIQSLRSSEELDVTENEAPADPSRRGSKPCHSIDSLEEPSEDDFGSAFDDESDKGASEIMRKTIEINNRTFSKSQEPCISAKPSFEHIENIEEAKSTSNRNNIATRVIPNFVDKSWVFNDAGEGSSRKSSISYTSYIESEKMASRLYQDPYPNDTCLGHEHKNSDLGDIMIPSMNVDEYLRSISINSFTSGFKFSTSANQLLETESRRKLPHGSDDELGHDILSVPISLDLVNDKTFEELSRRSSDATSRDFDAGRRVLRNEAHSNPLAIHGRKSVGALVNIFQARGLMPQSPRSPFNSSQSASPLRSKSPLSNDESILLQSSQQIANSLDSLEKQGALVNRRELQRKLARSMAGSMASDAGTEESSDFGEDLERYKPRLVNDNDSRTTREERKIHDDDLYG